MGGAAAMPYGNLAISQHQNIPSASSLMGLDMLRAASTVMSQQAPPSQLKQLCSSAATKAKNHDKVGQKNGERIYIDQIFDSDVLCGRGGKSNHHPGNKRYRQVVSEMKMTYQKTEGKLKKTDLSLAIVDYVYNYGGRFIKKDAAKNQYFILTRGEARRKTSQALREQKEIKWTN